MIHDLVVKIIDLFEVYATQIPVEIFTFLGAFIEEVIAPVPSPIVMTLVGSIAAAQMTGLVFLFYLAIIGAVGKTLGAWLLYFITDKAEDLIFKRFGRFLGVSHKDIEGIGKHLNGSKWDDVVFFVIRCLPIMPSAPVSIVAGFIKFNLRSFIILTFFGTIIRNMFFLYFGYLGASNLERIMEGVTNAEAYVEIGIAGLIVVFIGWIYLKRKKQSDPIGWIKKKLGMR
jgi:membrane protein DedA with SNARE-associated domain